MCGAAPPCAWHQFSIDRKDEHPVNDLVGYAGTVHADGFADFNGLFGEGKAGEQACAWFTCAASSSNRLSAPDRLSDCPTGDQEDCTIEKEARWK
tara:strand:- start:446 stop:730 length:285 start_codon:yes stop_codon:yes gene_type:complete